MSMTDLLGPAVVDGDDYPPPAQPSCAASSLPPDPLDDEPDRGHNRWLVLAVFLALAAGIGIGSFVSPKRLASAGSAATATAPSSDIAAVAEFFLALHLSETAGAEDLATLHPGSDAGRGATGYWVTRTAAVSVAPVGEDTWVATVAAELLEMVDEAYRQAGVQYFEVGIDTTGSRPVVLSAPLRVPRPDAVSLPAAASLPGGAVTPEQKATAVHFLESYLTGNGQASRYIAANTRLSLFDTPPYSELDVVALTADSRGGLRAEIEATSPHGATVRLEYLLGMTLENGVWAVADLQTGGGE